LISAKKQNKISHVSVHLREGKRNEDISAKTKKNVIESNICIGGKYRQKGCMRHKFNIYGEEKNIFRGRG
jgi:hypothetical protein